MQPSHSIAREEINDLVDRLCQSPARPRDRPHLQRRHRRLARAPQPPQGLTRVHILLTERSYKGDPLEKHLELSWIRTHFARWLTLFAETAREVMPPEHADLIIDKSRRIAETFKSAIASQTQ